MATKCERPGYGMGSWGLGDFGDGKTDPAPTDQTSPLPQETANPNAKAQDHGG